MEFMSRSVLIIQEHLPAFRVPFYETLRADLAGRGIELNLVFAPNQRNTFLQQPLEWAIAVPIRWCGPVAWQPVLGLARKADLVIVQQETKYLVNPVLQILAALGGPPVAYWGHGKNFQAAGTGDLAGKVKSLLATKVHWWFAYNDLSAEIVRDIGFPAERITSVGNTIDTRNLIQLRKSITGNDLRKVRAELKTTSSHIAVYTGGLYATKRIGFLLRSAITIRESLPDFELIVIGTGPELQQVAEASQKHPWIHVIGSKNDEEKVPYWAMASVLLMPGGVGLVILDSFALGVPMITTDTHLHGPEIDYLRNGHNGLMVLCGDSADAYAKEAVSLLRDPERLNHLRHGALESAVHYDIETMVKNFSEGIVQALESPMGHRR